MSDEIGDYWKKMWKEETERTKFYLEQIQERETMISELLNEKETMVKQYKDLLESKLRNECHSCDDIPCSCKAVFVE